MQAAHTSSIHSSQPYITTIQICISHTSNHHPPFDFFNLTIYKGTHFTVTNILDTKTETTNLYQYLHYTSHHPKCIYKALIRGECHTNQHHSQNLLCNATRFQTTTILKRQHPGRLVNTLTDTTKYHARQSHLQTSQPSHPIIRPPIFKCLLPSQF